MSLLQSLRNQKTRLKPSSTMVTRGDGSRFLQTSNGEEIPQKGTAGFVIDTSPDEEPSLVQPHLYVGSQDSCVSQQLDKHNIKVVVSIGVPAPYQSPNVQYFFIDCLDLPDFDLRPVIDKCLPILSTNCGNKTNCLVHCNAGVSRCSAIIIAFLIITQGLSYEDAFQRIKNARPVVQPNPGFIRQLRNLSSCSN